MTPQEREREALNKVYAMFAGFYRFGSKAHHEVDAALDEYRSAVEARVRWEQQADAEGYTEGRP